MTRLPAPGCGLRAYPGPGARPCPAVRVGRLLGDPATMSTCSAERAALLPGCGLRPYPGYAVRLRPGTRLWLPPAASPNHSKRTHLPAAEATNATPPKTCRAGWVTAAAMDGRGSECVQEVRPSGRDPPGAARLRPKPADTGPLSPTAHAGWASATTSYGSGARVERLPGCGLRPCPGDGARRCP